MQRRIPRRKKFRYVSAMPPCVLHLAATNSNVRVKSKQPATVAAATSGVSTPTAARYLVYAPRILFGSPAAQRAAPRWGAPGRR